jgi:hypothetical protein
MHSSRLVGNPEVFQSRYSEIGTGKSACLWRIAISPIIPRDSPSCYDSARGNLLVLFILWFAKAAAETQNGTVLGRVVLAFTHCTTLVFSPGALQ